VNTTLAPRTAFDGPKLEVDFPGLRIGVAEYEEGPTGCTVFHLPPGGAACAIDVRGGSSATIGNTYPWTHAICFAGGSLYGLEAACGVAAELKAMRGDTVGWDEIELVFGAIIYDFGRRENAIYPDRELGRAALRASRKGTFPLGARGAGRSATVGKTFSFEEGETSGQGGAFRRVGDTRIGVFTVVNAFGAVVDREGTVVRGHRSTEGRRTPLVEALEARVCRKRRPGTRH
jgi:6-aminohexanoate-oligomer endohydrolase